MEHQDDDEDRTVAAARNRERFPLTAIEVERWRRVFGPGVRLRYCWEDGDSAGSPSLPQIFPPLDSNG